VPTYQYACTDPACGHRFEAVQSVSDDSLTVCPVCEGRLRKVFAAVGVVFKGSGFYRTDSRGGDSVRSGSGKSSESTSVGSSSNGSSGSSGSSESSASSSSSASSGSTDSTKAAAS
jgi:putative FmdB family regulatory protein